MVPPSYSLLSERDEGARRLNVAPWLALSTEGPITDRRWRSTPTREGSTPVFVTRECDPVIPPRFRTPAARLPASFPFAVCAAGATTRPGRTLRACPQPLEFPNNRPRKS